MLLACEPSKTGYIEARSLRTGPPAHSCQPGRTLSADGKLYIRDQDTLFCYDVKAK